MSEDIYKHDEQQSSNARDLLTVFFKHKRKIAAIFLSAVGVATIVSFVLPPVYEAKSTLLVKFGREYIYRPEIVDKAPVISVNQEEAINSEINIMTSRDLIEKVLTSIGIEKVYPALAKSPPTGVTPLEGAIFKFRKDMDADVVKKSNVLEVNFRHQDPKVAAQVVNLLIEKFKAKHFMVYNGPESEFMESQVTEYERRLRKSEDDLQAFKQRNKVYALEEQRVLLLKQRTDLDTALKSTRSNISGMRERLSSLNLRMKQMTNDKARYTQTERDRIVVDTKAQLLNLQLKERQLLAKYSEKSRLVANVRKEIALVREFLQQQEEDIGSKVKTGNGVYMEAEKGAVTSEAEISADRAREKALQLQIGQLDEEIRSLDSKETEYQNLKRDIATNDKNYRTYLDRFEEARVSDSMNRQKLANLTVIQAATPPPKPVAPKKRLNVIIGAIFGAMAGLGYALFCEFVTQGFSTPERAAKCLGLPVLTAVTLRQ